MNLSYQQFDFNIKFSEPVKADVNPLFILRSMLGKHLRSMCCISRGSSCSECMYNKTCAYAYIFETIISQDNDLLPGTDRASHPFAFSQKELQRENFLSDFSFTITLFGKAIEYLPYIYAAFVRSGKDGVFKSRTEFIVTDVRVDGKSILIGENQLDTNIEAKEWSVSSVQSHGENYEKEVLVELKSPLRFKTKGKYTLDFDLISFMQCLFRRAKTLCSLYGFIDNENYYTDESKIQIKERKLRWCESKHYSARQKYAMELGGCVGSFKISGSFSDFELALLELNKIANAGKNTNFGLGQIDFWVR